MQVHVSLTKYLLGDHILTFVQNCISFLFKYLFNRLQISCKNFSHGHEESISSCTKLDGQNRNNRTLYGPIELIIQRPKKLN